MSSQLRSMSRVGACMTALCFGVFSTSVDVSIADDKPASTEATPSPAFLSYRKALSEHVMGVWQGMSPAIGPRAEVSFGIDADGDLVNVKIAKSSGDDDFDDSILDALEKASPAPAPPADVYEGFRNILMTFEVRN